MSDFGRTQAGDSIAVDAALRVLVAPVMLATRWPALLVFGAILVSRDA